MSNEKEEKKEKIVYKVNGRNIQITMHKLKNLDKNYLIERALGLSGRTGEINAVLVGLEKNSESDDSHVHILIQFKERKQIVRSTVVRLFGTDSVNLKTKRLRVDLVDAMGYISKDGDTSQRGTFQYGGKPIEVDNEGYMFSSLKNQSEIIDFYIKKIDGGLENGDDMIEKLSMKQNSFGYYLLARPTITKGLTEMEYKMKRDYKNSLKNGIAFRPNFSQDDLAEQYLEYIDDLSENYKKDIQKELEGKEFPKKHLVKIVNDDMISLRLIAGHLTMAQRFGWNRPHKSLNLHIWSEKSNYGKTRLINAIDKRLITTTLPEDKYYLEYRNKHYNVLISEEASEMFRTKSYSHIKKLFAGESCELNRKGLTKLIKEDNPLILTSDNESIREIMKRSFSRMYKEQIMDSRIKCIEIKLNTTLHFFVDKCIEPIKPKLEQEPIALKIPF